MRTFLFVFLLISILPAAAGGKAFVFDRPLKVGSHYECRISTEQSSHYSFKIPGQENPVLKQDSIRAGFHGYLTVAAVNRVGNPTRLQILILTLTGDVYGKNLAADTLRNAVVSADLTSRPARFLCNGKVLNGIENALLKALFHPALENRLSDLTGEKQLLPEPGKAWRPQLSALSRTLEARKIKLKKNAIAGGITYYGEDYAEKIRCAKFGILIESRDLSDYDFRFRAFVWLPLKEGAAVRIQRDATEVIRRVLSGNYPFASGTQVELISKDKTMQTMIPVEKVPELKSVPSSAGKNNWESLLR